MKLFQVWIAVLRSLPFGTYLFHLNWEPLHFNLFSRIEITLDIAAGIWYSIVLCLSKVILECFVTYKIRDVSFKMVPASMTVNLDFEQGLLEIYSGQVIFTCSILKPSLNRTVKRMLTLYQVYTQYIELNMTFRVWKEFICAICRCTVWFEKSQMCHMFIYLL